MGDENRMAKCVPASDQLDIDAAYHRKLQYDLAKNQLQIQKNFMLLDQRKNFEEEMQQLKAKYRMFLEALSYTVYMDSGGKVILAITDPADKKITAKPLLNIMRYRSVIYYSYQPERHYALGIFWENGMHGKIYFQNAKMGIAPQIFLRQLKAKGVLFLVSGRTEKKAAEALLAYSIQNADVAELPHYRGWNFMGDGKWHFADQNTLTMREVEKDAV